jgi:hypothetical protein
LRHSLLSAFYTHAHFLESTLGIGILPIPKVLLAAPKQIGTGFV